MRLPRAHVVLLASSLGAYTTSVERHLTAGGIAKSSARIYRISLTTWVWMIVAALALLHREHGRTT